VAGNQQHHFFLASSRAENDYLVHKEKRKKKKKEDQSSCSHGWRRSRDDLGDENIGDASNVFLLFSSTPPAAPEPTAMFLCSSLPSAFPLFMSFRETVYC
jgi:hypothetical protein